jgi:hypothetical protein
VSPQPHSFTRALLACASCLGLGLASGEAVASEHDWKLGLGAGYEHLGQGGGAGVGGSGRVTYAASDAILVLGELGAAYHPGSRRTSTSAWVGAAYVLDVLSWVPYVGLGAGAWGLGQGGDCGGQGQTPCFETRPGLALPYGLDYRLSPDLSVGVSGQTRFLLNGSGEVLTATSVHARVDFSWGD